MEAELVGDLGRVHGVGEVLLVGEHEEERVAQLVLVQHPLQLLARLRDTLAVVRVDDENDALRVLEVCALEKEGSVGVEGGRREGSCWLTVAPERADLVLSSDVPHRERNVLVLNSLNVESYAAEHSALAHWPEAIEEGACPGLSGSTAQAGGRRPSSGRAERGRARAIGRYKERAGRTNGGDGGNDLSKLELVENGSLSSGVESDHEDAPEGESTKISTVLPSSRPGSVETYISFLPNRPETGCVGT